MKNPRVAETVANALNYFDRMRYDLLTWCVMPNHVHVAARVHDSLDRVIHSWKSYTSHEVAKTLRRTGRLWQREYYDHIVRNEEELRRTSKYIMANPDKLGMFDWPWRGTTM